MPEPHGTSDIRSRVIRSKGVGYSDDRMEKLDKIVEKLIKEAESK
jgi:hypothetical protein